MKKNKGQKLAFTILELAFVLVIFSILMVGIAKGSKILQIAGLDRAQLITKSSPVLGINNLVVWYESTMQQTSFKSAEAINGVSISTWYNISPYVNKLTTTTNANQAGVSTLKPIYTTNAINGLPALKFDGNDWIQASIPTFTNNQLEAFVVCQRTSTIVQGASLSLYKNGLADRDNVESFTMAYVAAGGVLEASRVNTGSAKSPHPNNGTPYIFSVRFNGSTNTVYFNGASQTSVASTGNFGFDRIVLGARSFSGVPSPAFNGYIGELIVFDRTLNDEERKYVTQYLGKKWKITVS